LMRLSDGTAAAAKRVKPVVPAKAPSAAAVPIKFLRVRAVDELFTGGKYCDALVQCRGHLSNR